MLKKIILICFLTIFSHGLVIKNNDDLKNFYDVDNMQKAEQPLILQVRNNNKDKMDYKIILSKDPLDNLDIEANEESPNYVVIKSKMQAVDVIPYSLIQRLDKIKYMVLWLNLYCEMHPDCDKSVLNAELKKVRAL